MKSSSKDVRSSILSLPAATDPGTGPGRSLIGSFVVVAGGRANFNHG
ncbi:MAG: hypothetical protein ACK4ND_17020 [Cytophagaceae bacterium]